MEMLSGGIVHLVYLLSLYTGIMASCGGTLNATSSWQTFKSPGYPTLSYESNLHCIWHITRTSPGSIQLVSDGVHIVDSPSCTNDYVQYGNNPKICGTQPFSTLMARDSEDLVVIFHSDSSGSNKGFQAKYRVIPVDAVTTSAASTTLGPSEMLQAYKIYYYVKYILDATTPGPYDHDKPSGSNKVWVIDTMNEDFVVLVRFAASSMNCATDYVKALDGSLESSSLLQQWCDGKARTIRSSGTTIRLHFHSPAATSHSAIYFKYKGDIAPSVYKPINIGIVVGGTIGFLISMGYMVLFIYCLFRRRKTDKGLITKPIISASDAEDDVMTSAIQITVQSHNDGGQHEIVGLQVRSGNFGKAKHGGLVHHGQQQSTCEVGIDNPSHKLGEVSPRAGNCAGAKEEWNPDIRDGKLFLRSSSVDNDHMQ